MIKRTIREKMSILAAMAIIAIYVFAYASVIENIQEPQSDAEYLKDDEPTCHMYEKENSSGIQCEWNTKQ